MSTLSIMAAITAKEFKTKERGKSDFFSWNLYRWLRTFPDSTRIYRHDNSITTGGKMEVPALFIGVLYDDGWFHGANLRDICRVSSRFENFAYPPSVHRIHTFEDVTEQFWSDYRRIGVCAIHGDLAHKWVMDGEDYRRCEYCGKEEHRTFEVVRRVVELWN